MTERRRDPVTGEWRTFATHRQDRTFLPPADECPFCATTDPGSPTEIPWPDFEVAVFDNRFPPLSSIPPDPDVEASELYRVEPAIGATELIVYSDDHTASFATVGVDRIRLLVDVWADRYADLGGRDEVAYVLVFENRGEAVGVTLHHPHGQIYGMPEVPPLPARELAAARTHMAAHGTCLMCDVVGQERGHGVRLVAQNDSFLAHVPFAPRFPYEVHVVSHRHAPSLLDLSDSERDALSAVLFEVVQSYDALFGFPLPYVMAMHQAPTDEGDWQPLSHFHIEFTPLHRTATKLKYMAGVELGGASFLVDVAPEDAAAALRAAGASASLSAPG